MRALYHFRNAFFLCLLTFLPALNTVFAQTAPVYGHEWINYAQPHYKIQVVRNGLHRVSYNDLVAAGINNVNPEKFRMFRRGKELAIYVNGQNDQTLNSGDYIEFYGERNDGKLDVTNYKDPAWHLTPYYSLYTDTAAYFLTWGATNGKRMVEKTSQPAGLTPEPRSYKEVFRQRFDMIVPYNPGFQAISSQSYNSWGDKGEGYPGPYFQNSRRDTVSALNPVETTGRQPMLQVGIMSAYVTVPSKLQVKLRPPTGPERLLTNATSGSSGIFNVPTLTHINPWFQIQNSDIYPDGSVRIRVVINDSTVANNYARINFIKLQYAQTTDLLGKDRVILTDSTKSGQSYFLFSNPPANAVAYDITDPYNIIRTEGTVAGAQKGFVFDPSTNTRKILIANAQNATAPAAFKSVQLVPLTITNNYDYVIITHKLLHQPVAGTSFTDPPADYAAYRASAPGGGFNPIVIDMDQIYDQYHYGEKSPYAITNLMNRMIAYWVTTPDSLNNKHLFLLGKGIENSFDGGQYRKNPLNPTYANRGYSLVPTAGQPASDALFTSEWRQNKYYPRVATGRVPALTSTDVISYLEKVKGHEQQGLEDWRKNFLHLGGGDTPSEISQFQGYLKKYETKARGPLLGARVQSIFRGVTGTAVKTINVKDQLNNGLSLITFFGHSSANFSDLDIGFVSDPLNGYNNLDKYPMILMNGCVAGNSFQLKNNSSNKYSFGEDWMNTPKKGALMFLADAALALPNALDNFTDQFYKIALTNPKYYGKPVGEIMQQTIKEATKTSPNISSPAHITYSCVLNQMILHGDPAVRLFAPEKPDYKFAQSGVTIQSNPAGSAVTANSEQFDLVLKLMNAGKAITDSVAISIKRTLPNGDTIRYKTFKVGPIYSDLSFSYTIDNKNVSSFGSNTFEVTVDYGNRIDELSESNNKGFLTQYFAANGVLALLPVEFSIVSKQQVKLIGQPANLLSGPRDFYFELDTVKTFNSGFKKSTVLSNVVAKPTWTVNLLPNVAPKDSVVYYWRFRFNTLTAQEDTIWAESSFRYIPNSPTGWSQSHYAQFDKDNKDGVGIDPVSKKWEFDPTFREFKLKTGGGNMPFNYPGTYGIQVDNSTAFNGTCLGGARFMVTVYNNRDLTPYTAHPRNKCGSTTVKLFYTFPVTTPALVDTLAKFLQKIPNGYYVAMVSVNNVPFSTFTQTQKDAFKLIGSQAINTLQTGYPFAILGQKGAVNGTLLEEQTYDATNPTPAANQEVAFTRLVQGFSANGTITSTRIGPATSWTTLHHTIKKSGADDYELNVWGYDANGKRSTNPLITNVKNPAFSLATISATQYPFIQLEMYKADPTDRSAPQLKQWMVVYQGVPEGMIRPDLVGIEKYNIQKQAEKGQVNLRYAFSNISELPFGDSLTVVRSVIGNKPLQDTIKVAKLLAGDSVFFDFNFSTGGMKGHNIVKVDVNPRLLPEQYYFNNFLEVAFTMPNTDLHPTLDVAFDGVHIMDGDIVSPSPKIAINLKDEDKYDFVQDPDKLEVFLLRPGALNYEKIDLKDASLVTLPNLSEPGRDKRDFNIIYNPKNLPDGIYKLRVQGSDNSNHDAGFEPYTISFEVVNESAITHFYPYPNPFTSNTRFVFTVTGNPENIPRNLKIQVMTLTGKVVREIQKEELGIVKVGNNMSTPWDGTDEFGDKLANGTYLYRVVMEKAPLEEMKHRRTAGDKSFKKEYGKLYILR